jgi:TPR repeat protein
LSAKKTGLLYEHEDGLPKDYVQAYMWYKLGVVNGGMSGAIMRDGLATQMTSDQFSEAKKLAREWKPQNKWATLAH